MRTLFTSFILVLLVNAIAIGGLLGWLGATGRLSKERVKQAAAVFNLSIDQEQALAKEQAQSEQQEREMFEKTMRLQQVAGGPVTPQDRIDSIQRVDDTQRDIIKRTEEESAALKRYIAAQQKKIDSLLADLQAKQKAFDEAVASKMDQMKSEDFREAVSMLEGIPAKQAKAVLQQLLKDGDQNQVVSYLSAMEERKAAGVLKEFKDPNELAQAAQLIEQLRQRSEQVKQEADL